MKVGFKIMGTLVLTLFSFVIYTQQPPQITEIYPNHLYQGTEAILIIKGNNFGDSPVVKAEALQQEFPGTILLNLKEKIVVRFEYIPEAQLFIRVTTQSGEALAVLSREYVTAEEFTKEIVRMMGMISENAEIRMKAIVADTKQTMLATQDRDELESVYENNKEAVAALEEKTKDTLTSIWSSAHDKLKTFPEDVSVWLDILHSETKLYIKLAVINKLVCFDILKIWFGFQDANLQDKPCQDIRSQIAEIDEEVSELLENLEKINEKLDTAKEEKKGFEEATTDEAKKAYSEQIKEATSKIESLTKEFKDAIDPPLVNKAANLNNIVAQLLEQQPTEEHLKILRDEIKKAEDKTSDVLTKGHKKFEDIESFEAKIKANAAHLPDMIGLETNPTKANLLVAATNLHTAADNIRSGRKTLDEKVDDVLEDLIKKIKAALKE